VDHGLLRHQQPRDPEGVHQHEVGQGVEREHGPAHRLERRLVDVDPVDLVRLDRGDCPRAAAPGDDREELFALGGLEELRVAETGDVACRVEDHRAGHDGAGQAAPAYFVHAGDPVEPQPAEAVLDCAGRASSGHEPDDNGQQRIENGKLKTNGRPEGLPTKTRRTASACSPAFPFSVFRFPLTSGRRQPPTARHAVLFASFMRAALPLRARR
jgi:hypothetical protein